MKEKSITLHYPIQSKQQTMTMDSKNIAALQSLIGSLTTTTTTSTTSGSQRRRQERSIQLAERILSSSIGQISKQSTSHTVLLKKIERAYRKRISNQKNIEEKMNQMRELHGVIVHGGLLDHEVLSNLLLLFSRLAGTCSGEEENVYETNGSDLDKKDRGLRTSPVATATAEAGGGGDSMERNPPGIGECQEDNRPFIHQQSTSSFPLSKKHVQLAIQSEEMDLLRECLHSLQYIDGQLVRFQHESSCCESTVSSSSSSSGIRIRPGLLPFHLLPDQIHQHKNIRTCLSGGGEDAIRICGEAGWLYNRIEEYITHVGQGGVVPRALASALRKEMDSYRLLLVELERMMWSEKERLVSLRHLMVLLRGPIGHLQTLALIVDGLSDEKVNGGQLLTNLYLHSMHGDERTRRVLDRILFESSIPWYDLLYDWTMGGMLSEGGQNSGEFFVVENKHVKDANLWHGRYVLNQEQIPHVPGIGERGGLLNERLAKEILIVGKGINFIRKCLHDSEWNFDLRDLLPRKSSRKLDGMMMDDGDSSKHQDNVESMRQYKVELGFVHDTNSSSYFDISGKSGKITTQTPLEKTVAVVATQVHSHILTSLFEQHHLVEHLKGLKEILFLGQGDFICALMDGLQTEFDSRGSIHEIYMISLMNIVHDALRSTNAKFLPKYVTDRVQVRMLSDPSDADKFWSEETKSANELEKEGWDLFTLDYAIDIPLTAIVHPEAMEKYHLVFNLLFKLKRIEWMMNNTWRQSTTLNHSMQLMISKFGTVELAPGTSAKGSTNALSRMKRLLRKFSMTRQSMLHFLTNLQSYLMFEVLENGWKDLLHKLGCAKTLDEVISSHDDYLNEILEKSLVAEALVRDEEGNIIGGEIPKQLRLVLSATFRFCKMHEKIFSHGVETIQKATEKRRRAQKRSAKGDWGYDKFDADVEGMNFYSLADETRLAEVESISEEFDISLRNLLSMLNDRINGNAVRDVDISSPGLERPSQTVESDRANAMKTDALRFLTFRLDFSVLLWSLIHGEILFVFQFALHVHRLIRIITR
jgi:Spc97 / Spc98 family.